MLHRQCTPTRAGPGCRAVGDRLSLARLSTPDKDGLCNVTRGRPDLAATILLLAHLHLKGGMLRVRWGGGGVQLEAEVECRQSVFCTPES